MKRYSYQFVVVSEDYDLCENCSEICSKHFNKKGKISEVKKHNYYRFRICSKDVCDFVLSYFCSIADFKIADRYQRKSKMISFSSYEQKKHFIQGLMDSDGWISKRKNGKYTKYEVGFKNTSVITPKIYNLMKEMGLNCSRLSFYKVSRYGKNTKPVWTWTIHPGDYITKVGFGIQRKMKLCNEYIQLRRK